MSSSTLCTLCSACIYTQAGKTAHELGLQSKLANTMMKYRVIPDLKEKTKEEIEQEAISRQLRDEHRKNENRMYSAASGVKLGAHLKQQDDDDAAKKRQEAVDRSKPGN